MNYLTDVIKHRKQRIKKEKIETYNIKNVIITKNLPINYSEQKNNLINLYYFITFVFYVNSLFINSTFDYLTI